MRGVQAPRVCTRPAFASEDAGQDAIDFAASVGLFLDPWQQTVVRVALAEDAAGMFAAREVGFLVARQNGKGAVLEAIVLYGMFVVGDPLTIWTAHETKTSFEAFTRVKALIQTSPDLSAKTKAIIASHGDEGVILHNGVRLRFHARSKSASRGFSPQRVIFDEAQELSKMSLAASLPSMGAQSNWQAIYTGTVPGPAVNHPEHWTRLRTRGRAGDSTSLAWLEWTPVGSDDPERASLINLRSPRVLAQANPALGIRKSIETMSSLAESLDPEDVAREEASIWPTVPDIDVKGAISFATWQELADRSAVLDSPTRTALSVDVRHDGEWATVGVAGESNGRTLLMVKSGRGTSWVVQAMVELAEKHRPLDVALDPAGRAGALLPDLQAAGLEVHTMTSREMQQACVGVQNGVRDRRFVHLAQPELDLAVKVGKVRTINDSEVWDRRAGSDVAPLCAVTIAAHRLSVRHDADYDVLQSIG